MGLTFKIENPTPETTSSPFDLSMRKRPQTPGSLDQLPAVSQAAWLEDQKKH
jgi:hypothetical protein